MSENVRASGAGNKSIQNVLKTPIFIGFSGNRHPKI